MKSTQLMFTYEGRKPHTLDRVYLEHKALTCDRCGAVVSDHVPVGHEVELGSLNWKMTCKVNLDYSPYGGFKCEPQIDDSNQEFVLIEEEL